MYILLAHRGEAAEACYQKPTLHNSISCFEQDDDGDGIRELYLSISTLSDLHAVLLSEDDTLEDDHIATAVTRMITKAVNGGNPALKLFVSGPGDDDCNAYPLTARVGEGPVALLADDEELAANNTTCWNIKLDLLSYNVVAAYHAPIIQGFRYAGIEGFGKSQADQFKMLVGVSTVSMVEAGWDVEFVIDNANNLGLTVEPLDHLPAGISQSDVLSIKENDSVFFWTSRDRGSSGVFLGSRRKDLKDAFPEMKGAVQYLAISELAGGSLRNGVWDAGNGELDQNRIASVVLHGGQPDPMEATANGQRVSLLSQNPERRAIEFLAFMEQYGVDRSELPQAVLPILEYTQSFFQ